MTRGFAAGLVAVAALVAGCGGGPDRAGDSSGARACSEPGSYSQQMRAYRARGGSHVIAGPAGVQVPDPHVSEAGVATDLPLGPCQTVYRFKYERLPRGPFEYAEVDWNTEGKPRGPNNSFTSPHYDFHFYLWPKRRVDRELECESSNGVTCDPSLTGYPQMARFLTLPPQKAIPPPYHPDIDSSIPEMGLHHLDYSNPYTTEYVDHQPTLIYGSYDGEVIFLEASVTAQTLADAAAEDGGALGFPLAQPAVCPRDRWPTGFQLRKAGDAYRASFTGFRRCRTS